MPDSSLPAARSVSSSCLPLLPVLSLAALILGVAQSAQANDGSLSFDLAQVPTLPAESATPAVGNPDPVASSEGPTSANRPRKKRVKAPACDPTLLCLGQEGTGEQSNPASELRGTGQTEPLSNVNLNSGSSQATSEVTFPRGELFVGGSRSLVAKAVGAAEGTRTPDGHKTPAYYGHVDPGNRAWNLGSFSYQHGANSPEEADRKQLARLEAQAQILRQQAQARGVELNLEEELNGIDLANQAPLAALDRGGYIDRLIQARQLGMTGSEAVSWARAQSFIDPRTGRLNAPGLGNRLDWVLQDQERRRAAVERAIALHNPTIVNPGVEAVIQADTGSSLAEATPVVPGASIATVPPPEALSFKPSQVEPQVAPSTQASQPAVGGPAIAVKTPERPSSSPPEMALDSPVSRTIASWTEQARLLEQAPDTVINRLSAQAARVRSSLRSLDRMRSMLPVPATPTAFMESPTAPTPTPSPAALEPTPTPVQTPLPQPEPSLTQPPPPETSMPTPASPFVPEPPPTPAPTPAPVGLAPQASGTPDSSQPVDQGPPTQEPSAQPIPPATQSPDLAGQPTPAAPPAPGAPMTQAPDTTPPREDVAEALIHLDLPDFSLSTPPAIGP